MNEAVVSAGTWLWKHLPIQYLRQCAWNTFLWGVRGKKKIQGIDGIRFSLDLDELIDVCIYVRRFEPEVTAFIDKICCKDFVILDIGANIGAHCLRFAKLAGKGGMVYAFEPTDYAYEKLRRNISLNDFDNVLAYHIALSNQNLTKQTISYRSSWKTDGSQAQASSVVDFVRLDDWSLDKSITRLDIIKIDVDGNEFSVLDGGRQLLNKFKPLVIAEIGAWHFESTETNPWLILAAMGYRFWDLKTRKEYASLADLRAKLPEEDKEMGFSINVAASSVDISWELA